MMRKILFVLLIPILIAGLFVMDSMNIFSKEAAADTLTVEGNIVTVNGMGTVKVKPDIAYINVGVEIFNGDAKKAQDENARLMDKIVSAVKENGIKDEDIKTISYNIYRSIEHNTFRSDIKKNPVEGYYARNVIQITVRDIKEVGKIIDIAGNEGANVASNIRFGISDEEKYYNEALKLAMDSASSKAGAILNTFGAKATKPYRVKENSYGSPIVYRENAAMKSLADDQYNTPIEAGELEITARVTVEYKY